MFKLLMTGLRSEDIPNRKVGCRINGDTYLLPVMEIYDVDAGVVDATMNGGLRLPNGVCELLMAQGTDKALKADKVPAGCRNVEALNGLFGPCAVNVFQTKRNNAGFAAGNSDTRDAAEGNGIGELFKGGEERGIVEDVA